MRNPAVGLAAQSPRYGPRSFRGEREEGPVPPGKEGYGANLAGRAGPRKWTIVQSVLEGKD